MALRHAVRDTRSDRLVMIIASHPDDRWTLPAAIFRFGIGHEVHVVLATRGEGGQNRVGSETGDALGRVRTQEAVRSAARLDVSISFLDLPDLGFCRTGAEALKQWGAGRALARLADTIAAVDPHAIVTPHYAGENHGHDQALIALLPDALDAAYRNGPITAGESLPGLFRSVAPTAAADGALALHVDRVDPAMGQTFLEFAYEVLAEEHVSQRPLPPMHQHFRNILRQDGPAGSTMYLERFGQGASSGNELFAGQQDLFELLREREVLATEAVAELREEFGTGLHNDLGDLSRLVRRAARLDRLLAEVDGSQAPRLVRAVASRRRALAAVMHAGVGLRVLPDLAGEGVAVPGEELPLQLHLHNGGVAGVRDLVVRAARGGELRLASATALPLGLGPDATAVVSGAFAVANADRLPGRGGEGMPLALEVSFTVMDRPVRAEVPLQVALHPSVELQIAPPKLLITPEQKNRELLFSVTVRRNSRFPVRGRLLVNAPPGIRARTRFGEDSMVSLDIGRVQSIPYRLQIPEGFDSPLSLLQARFWDRTLKIPVHLVDARVPDDLHVGLVQGVDNAARDVLLGLGVRVTPLEDVDLTTKDLRAFDCILVDIRALAVREGARAAMGVLLRFAAQPGKRLTVLYHKDSEFNPDSAGFEGAPFQPFRIGKGRVTEPDAAVKVLQPEHPLLRFPNQIRAEDWDGWIQERGLYFAEEFDGDRYTPLLAMSDSGLEEERGSLLHCQTGGGEFVYCGLALFRQLGVSHPGAIRLLLNLVTPQKP